MRTLEIDEKYLVLNGDNLIRSMDEIEGSFSSTSPRVANADLIISFGGNETQASLYYKPIMEVKSSKVKASGLSKPKRVKLNILVAPSTSAVYQNSLSISMAFGGNTRDLSSFGEETNKTTNSTPKSLKEVCTVSGYGVVIPYDGVRICKRRRQDTYDGVKM
ncbi:hypothetical protein Tco_0568133 [Tanacetum coccineum]